MTTAVETCGVVTCEVFTDFARLEDLADRLAAAVGRVTSEVFQTFGWIRAFWKAHGHWWSLCTPVVYRGSEPAGFLPLALEDDTLTFLGSPHSDYRDVICDEASASEVISAAFRAVFDMQEHWSTCALHNVPTRSQILRHIRELHPPFRECVQLVFESSCSMIAVREEEDLLRKLSHKKSLRRHENKRVGARFSKRSSMRSRCSRTAPRHID
jgi:CelD/BcsL family acetyltransferase involved in cellulose biosynthesis